jgi:hypothetical protein
MAMSRKDFTAIAQIISEVPEQGAGPEWLASAFAAFLAGTNSRFDRDRFMRACGVGHLADN